MKNKVCVGFLSYNRSLVEVLLMLTSKKVCIVVVTLIISLFCFVSLTYAQGTNGYINADDVNMYSQPSADSKVIHVFHKGDRISYVASKDNNTLDADSWIEVSLLRSNDHGYVLAKNISDGSPQSRF